jgi:hypothetical protein
MQRNLTLPPNNNLDTIILRRVSLKSSKSPECHGETGICGGLIPEVEHLLVGSWRWGMLSLFSSHARNCRLMMLDSMVNPIYYSYFLQFWKKQDSIFPIL